MVQGHDLFWRRYIFNNALVGGGRLLYFVTTVRAGGEADIFLLIYALWRTPSMPCMPNLTSSITPMVVFLLLHVCFENHPREFVFMRRGGF